MKDSLERKLVFILFLKMEMWKKKVGNFWVGWSRGNLIIKWLVIRIVMGIVERECR